MSDFQNPCGGLQWRLDDSGMIEVAGEGYPAVDPSSAAYTEMMATWTNFGDLFQQYASAYGVPVTWVLAVATMETGYLSADPAKQAAAVSPAGAIGVMQIMPFNATPYGLQSSDQLTDPASNISVGVQILAQANSNATNGGLPGISAIYNSGKLCTTDPTRNEWMLLADADYPRHVIEWNNTAIQAGIGGTSVAGMTTVAILGAVAGGALALVAAGMVKRK